MNLKANLSPNKKPCDSMDEYKDLNGYNINASFYDYKRASYYVFRNTRKGQMASLIIEDGKRKINAAVFSQKLAQVSEHLVLDEVVVVSGKVNKDFREQWQVVVDKIEPVDKVQLKYAKFIKINLSQKNKNDYLELCNMLKEFKGKCPVVIEYESGSSSGRIPLSKEFDVSLDRNLLDLIEEKLGYGMYKINY